MYPSEEWRPCCRHKQGTKRVFGKLTMFEIEYINGGMAPLTDKETENA